MAPGMARPSAHASAWTSPSNRAPCGPSSSHRSTHRAYGDVSDAVESGAGLPEVARAVERALDASVAVIDRSGSVLAVACLSPDDERGVHAAVLVANAR